MKRRLFETVALMLPLAGLCGLWVNSHLASQRGTLWDVPVQGYDPRDLLRGHYITYSYEWPGLPDDAAGSTRLCISGTAPVIEKVTALDSASDDASGVCANPVRAGVDTKSDIRGLETGILYVPQARASELEKKLADPKLQGIIRIRVREDGLITPVDMRFRPRPAAPDGR